ncbi:hypothetical protein ERJ75_000778200 [Trypanosoma vivax]|nr:hypothetical protein TRVL_00515 [Trypanosoma vivax]KAH8614104.1 hypothetical protein ERJ75_000778200 [Trypanosoma vivax]
MNGHPCATRCALSRLRVVESVQLQALSDAANGIRRCTIEEALYRTMNTSECHCTGLTSAAEPGSCSGALGCGGHSLVPCDPRDGERTLDGSIAEVFTASRCMKDPSQTCERNHEVVLKRLMLCSCEKSDTGQQENSH